MRTRKDVRIMMGKRLAILCAAVAFFYADLAAGQELRRSAIGVPTRWEQVVLPGTELEVRPPDRSDSIVLRVVTSQPHGNSYRYDFEYYGLDDGKFELGKYLKRKDGTSAVDLPEMPVAIEGKLPPGQMTPHELQVQSVTSLGGYRIVLWIAGVLWVVGLVAIVVVGRKKREPSVSSAKPQTLADRLRPLVEGAQRGDLTETQRAELERMLLEYWRTRLDLGERKPTEVFAELRRHPEAGPLLRALESWLHRPGSSSNVDVNALLTPYRNLPAEGMKFETVAGGASS